MSTNNNKKVEVGFIWQITDDVLRDAFKKNEIGDVVLPFVVIRRLDCILDGVNENVRSTHQNFKDKVADDKLDPILRKAAGGLKFYNTSNHTLHSLKDDARNIEINFNNYLNGFNQEVRDILENFQFDKIVGRLIKNKLLYEMIDAICKIDMHTDKIDNHGMGYVFEELIRISNEQSNETAGEHFTPRDVIALMNAIMFANEKAELSQLGIIRTIFDPACGTGGMVNLGKKYILDTLLAEQAKKPSIQTYGQELNEQSYAIAKSEALITGEESNNVKHGNSFSEDQFPGKHFHYMMANPPYGVTWKKDQNFITNESLNPAGRFYAGLPRSSDGQLLFLQHMISKMEREGSRIAVVTNGSPLFTGDAGSGESDIRKWIIENDWLECIVALPKDMFYNTGINTYIWFLTNKKEKQRKGKVQLINAVDFCRSNKKSLGNKRNEITDNHIAQILELYTEFSSTKDSKIFDNDHFGFYQLTVEQPLYDAKGKKQLDKNKNPKADSKKRDKENVPIGSDIEKYFEKEVLPHVPDAWIDFDKTRLGYEINFTKNFYEYKGLRAAAAVKTEIQTLEGDITSLLKELLA
ncbi:type I restriction enzyme M protein [Flavobacterium fryxellicola]|uniref:site-specific DNA-methyltransferase (adenine-specific) n=1 Tax=Flavobacterium fryxellicola TaxID=249352 RepID=A0A167ZKM9_9FLAO|nr:class I SAM-dependent DNA methyltransferase [Flavobacterium fryxellicola]OAB30550.1 restriction endonuclease subunit M [Flavobacterium fryxellicola]SHN76948.1 type I restriction enzyme M protein [Flavobacterium fryxellicola]